MDAPNAGRGRPLRIVLVTVAALLIGAIVGPRLARAEWSAAMVIMAGYVLMAVVAASSLMLAVGSFIRRRRPRHARSSELIRILKGGGRHVD